MAKVCPQCGEPGSTDLATHCDKRACLSADGSPLALIDEALWHSRLEAKRAQELAMRRAIENADTESYDEPSHNREFALF